MKTLALLVLAGPLFGATIYSSNFNADTVTAYDSVTGASLGTIISGGAITDGYNGIRVGPGGDIFLVGQNSNNVARYNGQTGALIGVLDPANLAGLNSPQGLNFGPDGNLYVVSSADDRIVRYNPLTGAFLNVFATLGTAGHDGPIDLAFSGGFAYVTAFDSGRLIKLDAVTGQEVASFAAPAGFALTTIAAGADGSLYVGDLSFADFSGSVLRFTPAGLSSVFVPSGSAGLFGPGGIALDPNGQLLVTNLVFDPNTFADTGSTILRFNGQSGAFNGQAVGPGRGLDAPFFITVGVPEPATFAMVPLALACLFFSIRGRGATIPR